ncbi:hypothetical protein RDI58_022109 [Solanum bulbocastanum]|uniref:Uncharacterized protein n=1 Tax=Solanum bulbocastanum TaxID=147425 RepID=A0AAN8T3H6_SOLBU
MKCGSSLGTGRAWPKASLGPRGMEYASRLGDGEGCMECASKLWMERGPGGTEYASYPVWGGALVVECALKSGAETVLWGMKCASRPGAGRGPRGTECTTRPGGGE